MACVTEETWQEVKALLRISVSPWWKGAKAPFSTSRFNAAFTSLGRDSHPSTGSGQVFSQNRGEVGHPIVILLWWAEDLRSTVAKRLLLQLGVHGDFCVQDFGNRASFFGGFRIFLESCVIGSGNSTDHVNVAGGDGPSGVELVERKRDSCGNALRREIGPAQLR